MPERRTFRGHEVKNTRRLTVNGKPMIRITFKSQFGKPGHQLDVTPDQYNKEVKKTFIPGQGSTKANR